LADCVEKVLLSDSADFLEAAGAFDGFERGGPARFEPLQSGTLLDALKGHRRLKSQFNPLLREFCCRGIFDFFNTIGPSQTRDSMGLTSAFGGGADVVATS
jgi:hypothetical protein